MNKTIFKKLNITVYNTIFSVLFFMGLILTVCEINIYRNTFIEAAIPSFIWILTGLLASPFLIKILEVHYNTKSLFWQLFYNICTWGGIAAYLFMAPNFYFTKGTPVTFNAKITHMGHLAKGSHGCGEPYTDIVYEGVEKEIVFPCDVPVENYNSVELKIDKGCWGYDVIKSKILLKEN